MSQRIKLTDNPSVDCFALVNNWETSKPACVCLKKRNAITCGTKKCGFYKPVGCKDWIRVERGGDVYVVPPEEFFYK